MGLVQFGSTEEFPWDVGHYEPWILSLGQVFRFTDNPSAARPTVQRAVGELGEDPLRLKTLELAFTRFFHHLVDLSQKACISYQAKHIEDLILFTPAH